MTERFTGAITASLAEPVQEVFDLSAEDLGTCWVISSKNNGSILYVPETSVYRSGEREVIIPSGDGALFKAIEAMVRKAKEMVCCLVLPDTAEQDDRCPS
jgi:hypothetical protein